MGEKKHNFWIRTLTSVVYVAVMMGAIYSGRLTGNDALGWAILTALCLFVANGCAFEYYRIARSCGSNPNQPIGYAFTTLMTLLLSMPNGWYFNITILLIICVLMMPVTLLAELWRHSEKPFSDVLHTLLPVLYCGIPMGLMPMLHNEYNVLVPCIWLVWINDACAYMGGSLVGRHKMWVRHSPGKSWEGTAIGVVCSMVAAYFIGPKFAMDQHPGFWIAAGFICSVIGTLGDLCESMLKRSACVKDSGRLLPGHGGLLDRFDSLLMILPIVAVLVTLSYYLYLI